MARRLKAAAICLVSLLALYIPQRAAAQGKHSITVDELVRRHEEALGGREKMAAVVSTVMRGEYREGSMVIPGAYVAKMRPYYRTICDPADKPGEVCEGYDGSAWEWYADPGVTLRVVGAAAAATRHGTEFIDSLVDYQARGTKIELAGEDSFGGAAVWKLRVTLADGFEKEVFVDRETFLIVGDRRAAPIHAFGEAVRSENRIGDYREVNGVLFPFLFVEMERATGQELNRLTVRSIAVNGTGNEAMFGPPEVRRTALQKFLELLYMERTDAASVMSSYREFRAAHAGLDTREGVEFIGYQMAKMGDFKGAIALLEANAGDYPRAASAQYGLGRALKAAGEVVRAREAFRRALEIDPGFKKATEGLNALR